MRSIYLIILSSILFSSVCKAAAQEVVVIPLNSRLQPGETIEGSVEGGVLTLINNYTNNGNYEGFGVVGMQGNYSTDVFTFWESGGFFAGRNGVVGTTSEEGGYAVFGNQIGSTGGWAGRFRAEQGNGVWISSPSGNTGLTVSGGSKNAVVPTSSGPRLLYTEESTEVWFTDYGFGQLQEGSATVAIDSLYAETVNLDRPYHVFVQAYGAKNLYVTNKTSSGFEVLSMDGTGNIEFSYRIVALRLNYEDKRLPYAEWADENISAPEGTARQELLQ